MHEVPVYRVELVREGSLTVESPAVRRPADAAQIATPRVSEYFVAHHHHGWLSTTALKARS